MTCAHLTPQRILDGIDGVDTTSSSPCVRCDEELQRYRGIVAYLKESLTPPHLVLATPEELVALSAGRDLAQRLWSITGGWVALLGLAAAIVYGLNHLETYSAAALHLLREAPGGFGVAVAVAAVLAVATSPALVILGHPRLAGRSIR